MEQVEKLFYQLDKQIDTISQKKDISYLEATVEAFKFSDGDYDEILGKYSRQTRRKAYQYLMLKALKDTTQSHHQMTPDGIGYIIAFFIQTLTSQLKNIKVLELGSGTGNLLATVAEIIPNDQLVLSGVEIDSLYVELSALLADYLELPFHLWHQDALAPMFIEAQDIVIADVPVGYYPNDDIAVNYQLSVSEGHSFSHFLFVEQSFTLLKEGGYAILILPQHILDNRQASELRQFLAENSKLRGIINLPSTIFNHQQVRRSIVIIEKPLTDNQQQKEVLLASMPSMKDTQAIKTFFDEIKQFFNSDNTV